MADTSAAEAGGDCGEAQALVGGQRPRRASILDEQEEQDYPAGSWGAKSWVAGLRAVIDGSVMVRQRSCFSRQ
eukprot:SAG22_NODE_19037_length_278_cov_1.441341_1_plen_73_part_00